MDADTSAPPWQTDDVRMFRDTVRRFVRDEFVPRQAHWREQRRPDATAWASAGRAGLLLPDVPAEYGGGGGNYAHQCVVIEELARAGVPFGADVQAIVAHYVLAFGSETQKRQWLPKMAAGELVGAIAMTEPGGGSDLAGIATTARRDGDHYVIKGAKTFISNASHAGLVCLAARTHPTAPAMRALSMILVDTRDLAGYGTGRPLEKVGMQGRDACEMFFDDVRVPAGNLLGAAEGRGYAQMMQQLPYERLTIAVAAAAMAEEAVAITLRYAKERSIAGKPLFDLQNTRFKLAECAAQCRVGRAYIDDCVARHLAGRLDDASTAVAKYWMTESLCRIVDECVQLHGGYGYMTEYPIARMWTDSRVQRIYAGTNEIMKEVIAWSL
jgi:acyl-CoA dehydrogenase